MRYRIFVEGREEQNSLRAILKNIGIADFVSEVVYAEMQPKATADRVAAAVQRKIRGISTKPIDKTVVLVDLEDLPCAVERAEEIGKALKKKDIDASVVIKNRQFENWLLADLITLKSMPKYSVTKSFENSVKNKSDQIADPVNHLKSIKKDSTSFHKTTDGTELAQKVKVINIAENSRSFRRFLRLLAHPDYLDQSKKPSKKS